MTRVYHGPDGLVARSCARHGRYVVHALATAGCPRCRENTRHARNKRLARERSGLACDRCGTRLLTPAPLCGLCMSPADFDPYAVLASFDAPTPRERQ